MCNSSDPALMPARVYVRPDEERFRDTFRRWQGIPSIEVTPKGRVFVDFYTGQAAEKGGNFLMLCVSEDGGKTFRSGELVVEHPDQHAESMTPDFGFPPRENCG